MNDDRQQVAEWFTEGRFADGALSAGDVRDHYWRAAPALEAIATLDGHPTLGVTDYAGWYVKREHGNMKRLEAGFDRLGRVATFDQNLETLLGRVDRCLYAITTYKDEDATRTERPCTYDRDEGATVWEDGKDPMPGYGDLRAVPAWGDVDLRDAIKPERANLDEDTRETIEATLEAYIDEFATLYGDRDAVWALDSVGGAYIFGAPEATLPIAECVADDHDARARVFEAFIDRSNEWLREAERRVNARVDGAADVITPDWVNNKNRQFKAPLSLHADHDAVVTPLDTDDVWYEYTPLEAVDEDLIAEAAAWGEEFTAVEHTDRVATLVGQLWPDYVDEYGDWRDALEAWVADEREAEREQERRRREAKHRRAERKADLDSDLEGQPLTPFLQDVYDALNTIDTGDVVKRHAADRWDTGRSTSDVTEFDPSWRTSSSGSSCYVDHAANTFGDPGQGGGGYAAKAMALGEGILTDASADLEGADWWNAVDALRDAGYEIPLYTPEKGSKRPDDGEYDEMPFWAVRQAAVALGVCPPKAFVEQTADDDDTYLGFPRAKTYNNALEAIEDAGLEHGRERGDEPETEAWDQVAALFDSDVNGTTTKAYNLAADLVNRTHDFAKIRESDGFYHYDPDRGYYVRKGETYLEEILNDNLGEHANSSRRREIRDRVAGENYVASDDFHPPEGKANVENGVLDLDTRELEPHTPEHYFTSRVRAAWPEGGEVDPEAAEIWTGALADATDNPNEQRKLEEFIGYSLETWHHDREKNLFLVGPRLSGKSTIQEAIEALFGTAPTVTNLTPQQIADTQFDVASLREAALNTVNDINARKIEDTGTLKRVFSGERMKMEHKYQDAHFAAPNAKHLFTANWLPRLVGQDDAIYRRVLLVEFTNTIEDHEKDRGYKKRLKRDDVRQTILKRAVDARHRLHSQDGFTNDRCPTDTRQLWDSWRDGHKRFLYTQFEFTGDPDDTVDRETYWQAYREFATRKGFELKSNIAITKSLQYVPDVYASGESDTYGGLNWRDHDAAGGGDFAVSPADDEGRQTSLDTQGQRHKQVRTVVRDLAVDGAADRDAVIEAAAEAGMTTDQAEHILEKLLREGRLMEPRTGKVRPP